MFLAKIIEIPTLFPGHTKGWEKSNPETKFDWIEKNSEMQFTGCIYSWCFYDQSH